MNTINLHLEIDPANVKVAEALSNLILVMGGASATATTATATATTSAALKTVKTVKETFKDPIAEKPEAIETKPTIQDLKNEPSLVEVGATIQQLREELGKKVTEHREAIKIKLTACDGAPNVGKLDPKFYQEFFDFLVAL